MRIPAVFQCRVYTFLRVVILPGGMKNTRVFDGFGTAALAERLVSAYSLALVGLHFGRVALCVPINIRWEWLVEGTELLSSMFWARVLIC